LPEVNFCRQCGAAVPPENRRISAELLSPAFDKSFEESPTKRFEVRPTSPRRTVPENSTLPVNVDQPSPEPKRRFPGRPLTLILAAIVLLGVGVICFAAIIRARTHATLGAAYAGALIYPGSTTLVDQIGDEGRAIQLETHDPLDQVVAWYTDKVKPTKTMRMATSTVVLRNQNITTTIVSEDNKRIILIKQVN